MSVGILLAAMTVARTACADAMRPILVNFELPRNERRALERVACHPFNVGMRASIGTRFQTETGSFSAVAHCAQHATLYGNPVIFERFCHYAGGWTCEEATEMVLARYPDRQVNISAKEVSLTDAYWIVSYFVLRKDIERATIDDPLRWLKRLRSDGTTRYQQVPLPECATTDNPACVYGPALSVNEFREGKSGGE